MPQSPAGVLIPSLALMMVCRLETVFGLRCNARAQLAGVSPPAMRRRISISRTRQRSQGLTRPPGSSGRAAGRDSGSGVPPSRGGRPRPGAQANSSEMNPLAPRLKALRTIISLSCMLNSNTRASGRISFTRRRSSSPPLPGIATSATARSGRSGDTGPRLRRRCSPAPPRPHRRPVRAVAGSRHAPPAHRPPGDPFHALPSECAEAWRRERSYTARCPRRAWLSPRGRRGPRRGSATPSSPTPRVRTAGSNPRPSSRMRRDSIWQNGSA